MKPAGGSIQYPILTKMITASFPFRFYFPFLFAVFLITQPGTHLYAHKGLGKKIYNIINQAMAREKFPGDGSECICHVYKYGR